MGSSLSLSMLFLLLSSTYVHSHSSRCHVDESSALLEFKKSFSVHSSASSHPQAYPKADSWKVEEGDCCSSWDGVECDEDTGHVIGLDLSSSFLYGSFHPNSTLFSLVHLKTLNLADNFFNYSEVPSTLGSLTTLTYLNLSSSNFSGQIPPELSKLSKLTLLDFCFNYMLELRNPSLGSLVGNMSRLQKLRLDFVKISSSVPETLANLSLLTSLHLDDCGLYGEFPLRILHKLSNLRSLSLQYNARLTGSFPEYHQWSSPLEELHIGGTSFSGKLPASIGNLCSLNSLDLWYCNFSGSIPSSLGNLTHLDLVELGGNNFEGQFPFFLANLTGLRVLSLHTNPFSGGNLQWVSKLTKLTCIDLSKNNLQGEIPTSLGSLTRLNFLSLAYNNLSGQIPSSLVELNQLIYLALDSNMLVGTIPPKLNKLTKLHYLQISSNQLHGPIPSTVFELTNLVNLDLSYNELSGEIELDKFLELKNLTELQLSYNNLSLLLTEKSESIVTHQKFKRILLGSCNLTSFPYFMRRQDELEIVDLSRNNIHGTIPSWIWNMSRDTLLDMDLSQNFLTGSDKVLVSFPWTRLVILDLRSNKIQAQLPCPPPSTKLFDASNNSFTGNISPLFCKLTSLEVLKLSFNNLSGTLPQCFGILGESLSVLNLQNNNLQGWVPQRWTDGCTLKIINLSKNKLEGVIPSSLENCGMLESIDLSDNMINGAFPSWLGSLSKLRILILRSNRFHGIIEINYTLNSLSIFDISHNNFTGKLPYKFLESLGATSNVNASQLSYMGFQYTTRAGDSITRFVVYHSMRMSNKATMILYEKIIESLTAIDLSCNGFEGQIPASFGKLQNLYLLNLSRNALSGQIPSSLSNLTQLEALDLSHNKLSGEIPSELAQLNFLSFFDASHNHLEGRIPQGVQFDTFKVSSFEGNSGLCGDQLLKKCGVLPSPSTGEEEDQDSGGSIFDPLFWVIVSLGYACGLVVGVTGGNAMSSRIQEWISRTFGD